MVSPSFLVEMPTLKPQSYASLIEHAYQIQNGYELSANFDLNDGHCKFLFNSLPDGDNSLDYVGTQF